MSWKIFGPGLVSAPSFSRVCLAARPAALSDFPIFSPPDVTVTESLGGSAGLF
jgi:hypothetical protein